MSDGERVAYRTFVSNSDRWEGFTLRDGDIVISTPPKCGTTWMQMQVALLLFRTPELPEPLATLSPWLEMNTRPHAEVVADLEAQTHRRFIKSHTPLDGLPRVAGVTYLHVTRDPRDVALSWDNHMANIDLDRLLETRAASVGLDDLDELGAPPEVPEDPVERFWFWVEGYGSSATTSGLPALVHHSGTFWRERDDPAIHLFHYGDQRADLAAEMTRLAAALGVDPPTDDLVEAAQFERMQARSDHLMPNSDVGLFRSTRQFFDKARSGEWRELVSDADLPRYEAAVRAATDDEELITWLHGGPIGP